MTLGDLLHFGWHHPKPAAAQHERSTLLPGSASTGDLKALAHHHYDEDTPALRSAAAALEVGRQLAHLHDGDAQDTHHATSEEHLHEQEVRLCQQLLSYAQEHPEVLGKRCFTSHVTLWHRVAESGNLGLLRAYVAILRQSTEAIRAEVMRRYPLRIGAPNLDSDDALLQKLINGATVSGLTPLHLAAIKGHAKIVGYLLGQGADAWKADPVCQRTALHFACIAGRTACAALLIQAMEQQHDANGVRYVDARTASGMTSLQYAAGLGYPCTAKLLLRSGADMNAAKEDDTPDAHLAAYAGSTALHLAAANGHVEIARDILQAYVQAVEAHHGQGQGGAGVPRDPRRAYNIFNLKPHHMATDAGHAELARLVHPSRSLQEMFGLQELAAGSQAAVPALAVMAAAALQTRLLAELEALSPSAEERVEDDCAPRGGSRAGDAAAAEGDDEESASVCDVCMDARSNCAVTGCHHHMCASCARKLCRGMRSAPVRCPFCRGPIDAFVAHGDDTNAF